MVVLAYIGSAVFGLIGGIHLALGLTQQITGLVISGSICLAIFLISMFFVLRHQIRVLRLPKTGRKVWALINGFSWSEESMRRYEANGRRKTEKDKYFVHLDCEAEGKKYSYSFDTDDPDSLIGRCIPIYFSKTDPDFYRFAPKEIH